MSSKQVLLFLLKRNFSVTNQLNKSKGGRPSSRYANYVKYTNIYEEPPRSKRDAGQRVLNKGRKLIPYDKRYPITGKNTGPGVEGGSILAQELAAVKRGPPIGFVNERGVFKRVPELQTEFVVPNLEEFDLKPYVPYDDIPNINKGKHTAREIFDAVYAENIKQTFYSLTKDGDLESVDAKIDLKPLLENPNNKITSAGRTMDGPIQEDEKTVEGTDKKKQIQSK